MVSWLIKASTLAACLFLANKAAAEESSVVDAESDRALVKFEKYLADPDVPENKKAEFKEAVTAENKKADLGKPCCAKDVRTARCQRTYTHSFYQACGFWYWDSCKRTDTRYMSCKKEVEDILSKVPVVSDNCPKHERVCCPGTFWDEDTGKCLDKKELCNICDCCS